MTIADSEQGYEGSLFATPLGEAMVVEEAHRNSDTGMGPCLFLRHVGFIFDAQLVNRYRPRRLRRKPGPECVGEDDGVVGDAYR